ncbi:protein TolQ [Beggiatoa leptomitoformis]|uniref:Tol-Pal system protein TolQ n=1 Tax=Beggiatoa leptomitoformis TaxID=288004 RepID=A0A2N9YIR0_9GAMM|nr:protein TolQ [Beggiatoa leptomitoformis]ALG67399.1 protein TolQ [Beggiatoa leptomitoformis]AUI70390.1 protein TolQ [Beggiatoa leptomitoformis]
MADLSILNLVLQASLLVQLVMALLLLTSLYSWTLILGKARQLSTYRRLANEFEDNFWREKDYVSLYNRVTSSQTPAEGMASIFVYGYREFFRLRKQPAITPSALVEGSERAMRVAINKEADNLDAYLTPLATIGSVSPYIGLFGTVWGIMHSFHALGGMEQVTLAMVAPGISEALIATATGLFAAIPAVMAYNHYANEVDRLNNRYDTFSEEFTSLLQRQAHAAPVSVVNPIVAPAPVVSAPMATYAASNPLMAED